MRVSELADGEDTSPTDRAMVQNQTGPRYHARERFFFAVFMMLPRQLGAPHLQT